MLRKISTNPSTSALSNGCEKITLFSASESDKKIFENALKSVSNDTLAEFENDTIHIEIPKKDKKWDIEKENIIKIEENDELGVYVRTKQGGWFGIGNWFRQESLLEV